jgi:hypothetical protein
MAVPFVSVLCSPMGEEGSLGEGWHPCFAALRRVLILPAILFVRRAEWHAVRESNP